MDISIAATVGFTTAAVIGIVVLVFFGSKGKERQVDPSRSNSRKDEK